MKFAHFSHIWGKPGMTPHQRYEQLWRELQACDALGFDYGFCVEHHFRPDESWMSSPSLYAVGAGARTRRMRIGPMGYVVPLYHPLRLVEEIAIVDQMLGGRMEIGLVPGINADYFKPFGLDYNLRKSPTLEFVDYLRAAYGTIVHVDETYDKALGVALARAALAYEGFLPPPQPGETFEQRVREHAKKFIGRGEPGASEIMANLFDADYLMKHELVFIGSPETVANKIHAAAQAGLFNVLMGEFNFSDLPEADLLRSIRLFGEKVIPALRDYEPF